MDTVDMNRVFRILICVVEKCGIFSGVMFMALCVLLFSSVNSLAKGAATDCVLEISGIEGQPTHIMAAQVLEAAYKQIGCTLNVHFIPGVRSLAWANSGKTDGDIARISGTEKAYPNLVQVPTPVITFRAAAFTINGGKPIKTWEDLRGLRIGIVRGIRYAQIATQGMSPIMANDIDHLFSLLVEGRISYAVSALTTSIIKISGDFKGSGIHQAGAVLYDAPLYHFLNEKHAILIDPLNAALQEMESSGETERILEKARMKLPGE